MAISEKAKENFKKLSGFSLEDIADDPKKMKKASENIQCRSLKDQEDKPMPIGGYTSFYRAMLDKGYIILRPYTGSKDKKETPEPIGGYTSFYRALMDEGYVI